MNYKKTYVPAKGYTPICKIGQCSLKKLEFGIIELDAGEKLPFYTEDKETAFIMLEGHGDVTVNGETWEELLTLENAPVGYAYPAIICDDEKQELHLTYTWKRERIVYWNIKYEL